MSCMGHQSVLTHYQKIVQQHTQANYLLTKKISVSYHSKQPLHELWNIHNAATKHPKIKHYPPKQSLLDLKILIADKIFTKCCFCCHRCQVNRTQSTGLCQQLEPLIPSMFCHHGEEEIFVPSFTIFFSGCNFHCTFCQNWDISQNTKGLEITPEKCADYLNGLSNTTIKNINWVGGEPTPHIPFILKILQMIDKNIPQIWNSNMYCSTETLLLLDGVIDVYLTDFKFGNNSCAHILAQVPHYVETIQRNHQRVENSAEFFIRHL